MRRTVTWKQDVLCFLVNTTHSQHITLRDQICSASSTHPGRLNLSGDRMLCIRVNGTYHRPIDATAGRATVKEGRIGGVDGQVPRGKLRARQ